MAMALCSGSPSSLVARRAKRSCMSFVCVTKPDQQPFSDVTLGISVRDLPDRRPDVSRGYAEATLLVLSNAQYA